MTLGVLTPPSSLVNASDQMLRNEADRGFTRIYQAHAQLKAQVIQSPNPGAGFNAVAAHQAVTGSMTGVSSGLTTVTQVVASIDNGDTATNLTLTSRINPLDHSKVDLFVWQPTSMTDNTPIPATVPVTIRYWTTGA